MRRYIIILFLISFCIIRLFSQVYNNPVFDRTDQYRFRVNKVEITYDTTYVYCLFQAEDNSWANISKDTFLEDISSGDRLPLLKVSGLPFSPQKRQFTDADTLLVLLCFPHIETNKFNIIENEHEESFNIYGIDINRKYIHSYASEDISTFFELAQKEKEMENWQSAVKYSLKQLEATDYVEGIRSFPSVCAMYNLTKNLFGTGEYDKVITWGDKAIDIISTLPKDTLVLDALARLYGNVGTAYRLLKQVDVASCYEELSLTTRRLGKGIGTLSYELYLNHLAAQYYREGNYPKALLYEKEVVDIYKAKYDNNSYKYGCIYLEALCNLCQYYCAMEQLNEAVMCGKKALDLFDKGVCNVEKGLKYWIYNQLAAALASNNQVDEAIKYLNEIFSAYNSNQIEIHNLKNYNKDDLIISSKSLMASIYLHCKKDTIRAEKEFEDILRVSDNHVATLEELYVINRLKDINKAMYYLKKAIIIENEHSKESVLYADLMLKWIRDTWVDVLTRKTGIDSLTNNIHSVVDIIKRHITNTSFNLSRNEREAFWQRYRDLFTWLIPTISGILNTQEANSLAYDASLFYKGLLLSSEIDFKHIIEEENDDSLSVLYNNYVRDLSHMEELYAKGASNVVTDSLKTIINEEEYMLCQKVTRFNRQYKGTNVSWKDVRNSLKEQEAAIEIIAYKNISGNNIYYDAYIVGKGYEAPKQFFLCSEKELKGCLSVDYIDYVQLSILILGNEDLQKELKKYKTLFISPAGLMNTIGIEYLPIEGNISLSDRFNIYRVSSTREVCIHHGPIKIENVCIFGGLDYDCENLDVVEQEQIIFRVSRAVEEAIISRGGFEPLYGSKAEVEMIKNEMTKERIKSIMLYKGADGSEDCFKQLSGNQINILHLSTHGMFVSSNNTYLKRNNNFQFIIADEDSIIDKEAQSLTRSFLVMSGGNKLVKRDYSQPRKEDEILTSLEISHLDFKNLDLVVLSACQTALGDIDADGVYGLQRGFKKAGAKTILMSLDRVDDEATQILMVEFYRNLMDGKTKLQSLRNAQKYLRTVENGKYDDPKYWASFIMLDGLN